MRGFHLLAGPTLPWPAAWISRLRRQSLAQPGGEPFDCVVLTGWNLPPAVPEELRDTLLEELAWALIARPWAGCIVAPFYNTLRPARPATIMPCARRYLSDVTQGGGLALWRPEFLPFLASAPAGDAAAVVSAADSGNGVACLTRALIEERSVVPVPAPGVFCPRRLAGAALDLMETHLTGPNGRRLTDTLRGGIGHAQSALAAMADRWKQDLFIARRKGWVPRLARYDVAVAPGRPDGRIHVLMALHWLELGGAERFAVDLIRALPRDRYAVYVTTDVPSENSWAERLSGFVEEIVHLPTFLGHAEAGPFFDHFIRTRDIRLLHIHHSGWAYDALPYLRRFHPALRVLDTLHIIELPPHAGGYPELSCAHFEPFIDAHHVISDHLRHFLVQRWRVPDAKVRRIYLNVDTAHFNAAGLERGVFRVPWAIPPDALLVAFVGRFVRQKRPLDFLRMAALLIAKERERGGGERLRFVMAGRGPLLDAARRQAARDGTAERVTFVGEMPDMRPLYRDADLVVLASENEGLALTAYEAMAMGVPVVSTDVGAQSELVPLECLVSPDGDLGRDLFAKAWSLLMDPSRLARLAQEGQARILSHHRLEETWSQMARLYGSLLEPGPTAGAQTTRT